MTYDDKQKTVTLSLEESAEWRKAAGLHIDPETAEVLWKYTQVLDPYGDWPDIPKECHCVGRSYFARSPGMDIWVEFGDLPDATRKALCEKHESRLAFPAGLDFIPFLERYLERNFAPLCSLFEGELDRASQVELGRSVAAAHEAYLAEKAGREEAHDEPTEDR